MHWEERAKKKVSSPQLLESQRPSVNKPRLFTPVTKELSPNPPQKGRNKKQVCALGRFGAVNAEAEPSFGCKGSCSRSALPKNPGLEFLLHSDCNWIPGALLTVQWEAEGSRAGCPSNQSHKHLAIRNQETKNMFSRARRLLCAATEGGTIKPHGSQNCVLA